MAFLLVRTDSQTHENFFVNLTLPKAGEVEGIYEVEGRWSPSSAEGCVVIEVPGPGIDYGDYLKPTAIPDLNNVPATTQRRQFRLDVKKLGRKITRGALIAMTVRVPDAVDPALGPRNVP